MAVRALPRSQLPLTLRQHRERSKVSSSDSRCATSPLRDTCIRPGPVILLYVEN